MCTDVNENIISLLEFQSHNTFQQAEGIQELARTDHGLQARRSVQVQIRACRRAPPPFNVSPAKAFAWMVVRFVFLLRSLRADTADSRSASRVCASVCMHMYGIEQDNI